MIELPSVPMKLARNVMQVSSSANISNSTEVVENIYEIVETIQKICSNMNSYFGKKVKLENFSTPGKSFIFIRR